jgi:hypothetical protein
MAGAIVIGVGLVVAAAVLFAAASPLRALLLNQSVALETAASEERAASAAGGGGGIASGMQKILGGLAAIVSLFPLAGWLLLLAGLAKIALGGIGRTVVTVAAGGAEVEFDRRGNNRPLHEFVAEVGRQLPGPRG